MKFAKLLAFFGLKNVATSVAEKGDGTLVLTAEQAAAAESLAGELETANEKAGQLQTTIDNHVENGKTIRTELGITESATTEEVITAIKDMKTKIETFGKQPGTMGTAIVTDPEQKPLAKVETDTVTSFDKEAQDIYKKFHGK